MFPEIKPFKFWCQKVLPLVYEDSLSYYEVLAKVVKKLDEVISTTNNIGEAVEVLDGQVSALATAQSEQYTELSTRISDEVERALGAEYDIRADLSALGDYVTAQLPLKQDKLTAGQQITLDGATISAENRGHVVFYGDKIMESTVGGNPVLIIDHQFISSSPYNQGVPIDVGDIVITNADKTLYGATYKKGSIFHVTANVGSSTDFGVVEYLNVVVDESTGAIWGQITGTLSNQTDLQNALNAKEDTSNKVTSMSASSTDTQYPSAKAVYDAIQNAGSTPTWGDIIGTLSNQTDLQTALDGKLSLSGGTMTGNLNLGSRSMTSGSGQFTTINNDGSRISIGSTALPLQLNSSSSIYKGSGTGTVILDSSNTSANPTLSGGETALTSLKLNGTNYAVGGSTAWGGITGTLANQTDLQNALNNATELFWCTYGTTTYAEITAAIAANKLPVCKYNNRLYLYIQLTSGGLYRFMSTTVSGYELLVIDNSNAWSTSSGVFETTSYKVTAINANSTDQQYPSAKCVYDAIIAIHPDRVFWCTYGTTTRADIAAALAANKIPAMVYNSKLYIVTEDASAVTVFSSGSSYINVTGTNTYSAVQTESYLETYQGTAHAGEFLVVGNDGNVTTVTMAQWTGGSY